MISLELCILIGVWLAAIGSLLGVAYLRNWLIARQKLRLPVAEKLLRAPGESLRKKLEALEEQISTELAIAFALPLLYTGSILAQNRQFHFGKAALGFQIVVGVLGYGVIIWRIHRLVGQRRRCRLGLSGGR